MKDSDPGEENKMQRALCLQLSAWRVSKLWCRDTGRLLELRRHSSELKETKVATFCRKQSQRGAGLTEKLQTSAKEFPTYSAKHCIWEPTRDQGKNHLRDKSTWGSHSTWNHTCSHLLPMESLMGGRVKHTEDPASISKNNEPQMSSGLVPPNKSHKQPPKWIKLFLSTKLHSRAKLKNTYWHRCDH